MFDVFYIGQKPGVFAHEQAVCSLQQAQELCRTRHFWMINYLADYDQFDFLWQPPPWQQHQRHAWASQYQQDSGTYLVPRLGYEDTNYHTESVRLRNDAPMIMIDHGNDDVCTNRQADRVTRFVGSYLETLRRVIAHADSEWIWVASSVCDYTDFDWNWHPSVWQQDLIHVFASNEQRFGDTFYLHVPTAREILATAELLDWANLNFVPDIKVPRIAMPVTKHSEVTQVAAVATHQFRAPLELFTMNDLDTHIPTISLWRDRTRTVTPLTPGATSVIVPRDIRNHLRHQFYDYPWLDRSHANQVDPALDVVFVSNGEVCAQRNYEILARSVPRNMKLHWVQDVSGRVASQRAAARISSTEFYFFVPAKLAVRPDVDWHWHPDMMQQPKHWIFYAHNAMTGLTYGHGAMVCYCRSLVLGTAAAGLDFTMSQPHTVVPVTVGDVDMGSDPRTIWRTAFRETVKLAWAQHTEPDIDTEFRLERWLKSDRGDMGVWSQRGAQSGWQFFQQHCDDFEQLQSTYEWSNLDQVFAVSYPNVASIL